MTDPLPPEQVAERAVKIRERLAPPVITDEQRELCESGDCGGCIVCEGAPIPLFGQETVLDLLATVEAQGAMLQRFKDGWWPSDGWWDAVTGVDDVAVPAEPMTEFEQRFWYGEVVNEEAGDGSS